MITRLLPLLLLCLFHPASVDAQQPDRRPNLALGDAVVTGFSGTRSPDPAQPHPANKSPVDLTFINPDGAAARIVGLGRPGYVWDGRLLQAPKPFDVLAKDVGQVFGVALDDQSPPNIYLAATSAFGLQIAGRGRDGQPERRKTGGPGAGWMKGQFGLDLQGGPGSIYKVDGTTGVVSLFANVTFNDVPNPGPGLGNLAYDSARKQLFASDLYTGMIHRFDLEGRELGAPFDHGVTGRPRANTAAVPFDPRSRLNIAAARFDSEKPDTWGFAPPTRRVWGLAVNAGRLYYSARNGSPTTAPQIWSVAIQQDGSFGAARWELDVADKPGPYPVSDIAFSQHGAMILAQRAPIAGSYDYSAFTVAGEPRVLRYRLKDPSEPRAGGAWKAVPEEYAVGFAASYRNTNGGVALGYGYGQDGTLSTGACDSALWTTGQHLRNNPALQRQLEPGGPLLVHGLQGSPADLVRGANEPPATSYFIDYDDRFEDAAASGHMGSVRILARPCAAPVASSGAPGSGSASSPPYVSGPTSTPPGGDPCVGPNCFPPPVTPVDLKIEKKGATSPVPQVNGYSFTLTISNTGAPFNAASGVIAVSDFAPAGMTFTAASGSAGWTCTPATVPALAELKCTYAGGPIPTGVVGTITITATADGVAPFPPFTNCATVGLRPDTDPRNNRDCVTITKPNPPIDVAIKKSGKYIELPEMPMPGVSNLSFDLAITNIGAAFTGNYAITVTDVVPAGVTFNTATGTDWTCITLPASAGQTINCTYTGSGPTAPGASLGSIAIAAFTTTNGPWENCANVAIAVGTGVDSNLDDNKSCVTVTRDGFTPVKPPPPIAMSCGTNVIFVVDVSGSIAQAGATSQVQSALNNAKQMFNNVNSSGVQAQGAVITFSDTATLLQPMSAATLTSPATLTFGGETNWEAAMQLAYTTASSSPLPTIIVFITDGIPNRIISSPNTVPSVTATNAAIPFVNQIYGLGIPILGIGIFNTDPINGPIHLHALLGGNDQGTTFGGLYSQLQSFAKNMCADLYLTKFMNSGSINYYQNPGPHTTNITLTLQNTGGALTGVQAQDALPPRLTNPTSTDPAFSNVGNVVTWNVGNMAANTTVTLTFTVTIVPPALTCNWSTIRNFAQVTQVNQTIHSTPNSFANAVTGPVVQHDEASAAILLRDCEPPPPGNPYLLVTKSSLESCLPAGQQTPVPSTAGACTFTVKIQAVGNFVGNVVFGDAVFTSPGGAPVASALSSITLTPPPVPSTQTYCASSFTTTAASCTQNNVTLNNGHMITYTFTLAAPPNLAPGNYKNCFMAAQDTLPAAQKDLPYYNANSPVSQWYPWGDCGVFTVPTPAAGIVAQICNPNTTRQEGNTCVCRFPSMTKSSPTTCICPANMRLVPGAGCMPEVVCNLPLVLNAAGTECVRPPTCLPPMVPGPVAGQCICPPGTVQRGRECVKQPDACLPPMVPSAVAGQCVCPPGTVQRGRECVKVQQACLPPMVPGPVAGQCVCPQGTVQKGRECVPRLVCRSPLTLNSAGTACVCPAGLVRRGRSCEPPLECRAPMMRNNAGTACVCPAGLVQRGRACVAPVVCNAPAKLNRRGACECPRDMVARGNSCIERRPTNNAPGGIRGFPGGGRDNPTNPRGGAENPAGPRGGSQNESPGRR
jgi:hypothetical protein